MRWLEEATGRLITEGGITDSSGATALSQRAYQRMAVPPFVSGLPYIRVVAIGLGAFPFPPLKPMNKPYLVHGRKLVRMRCGCNRREHAAKTIHITKRLIL